MLCCIIGVFVVVASDTTQTYHVAIVGYLACGLVLTSSSVNGLIYTNDKAKEATAAGHILLSMVNVGDFTRSLWYMLTLLRSSGYSTLDQLHQLFHEPTSTHLHFTKITELLAVGCQHMVVDDQILLSHQMCHHRCTHLHNLVDSRLPRQSVEAMTTATRHQSSVAIFHQLQT